MFEPGSNLTLGGSGCRTSTALATSDRYRVWDVAPDGVADAAHPRGYRFDFNSYDPGAGTVRVPLFGNRWTLPAAHRIRLDIAQVDQPALRAPNTAVTSALQLSGTRLTLAVRETARRPRGGEPMVEAQALQPLPYPGRRAARVWRR